MMVKRPIQVEAYSGYKADERPKAFHLEGEALEVLEILDRWYGTQENFFKVLARDGNVYILSCDFSGQWSLVVSGDD